MEMGYLTALHVRLGAKFGDLHAKDSHSFRNRLITSTPSYGGPLRSQATPQLRRSNAALSTPVERYA